MTERDWEKRREWSSYKSSIVRGLYGKPIYVRTLNTLLRNIGGIYRTHQDLVRMTYGQFLVELAKPDGGKLRRAHGIGSKAIQELRQLCQDDLIKFSVAGEYGYA